MNSMMRLSLGALLVAMLVGLWAGLRAQDKVPTASSAAEGQAPRTLADVDKNISQLAHENDVERKALAQGYSDKRKALVESDEWRGLSRVERRSRLKSLQAEFKESEDDLKNQYKTKREQLVRERQALEDSTEAPSVLSQP